MKQYLFSLVVLFLLSSCQEDNETVYSVDPQLQPYVNTFYEEAAERGVIIPKNLVAEIKDIQEICVAGTSHSQNYLHFDAWMFDYYEGDKEAFIGPHIYNRLGGLFLKRSPSEEFSFMNWEIRFREANSEEHEALFNELFE